MKMLYSDGDGDIISQYVAFTKIYQKQARLLGKTKKAVRETIRICKDKDVTWHCPVLCSKKGSLKSLFCVVQEDAFA